MYKILTHLHTQSPGIYRFHAIDGIEFATEDLEEAAAMAKEVLTKIGYDDIKIIDDKDFYIEVTSYSLEDISDKEIDLIETVLAKVGTDDVALSAVGDYNIDLIWGKRPAIDTPIYTIDLITTEPLRVEPQHVEVLEHGKVELVITSEEKIGPYHLLINGEPCDTGLPIWIQFELISETEGRATLLDITQNYVIEIIPDKKDVE